MIDLKKEVESGSLRWIGQTYDGISPEKLIVAGKTINAISKVIDLPCYQFGNFEVKNMFIAHDSKHIFYVFVNPYYKNYRDAFKKVVGQIPDNFDFDHVLSKNLAKHFGYGYVLLCSIPRKVNSKHSRYEKIKVKLIQDIPDICYLDDRVFDKVLSRNPTARRSDENLLGGYTPLASPQYGLTLKQKGIWNTSFAFHLVEMSNLISKTAPITS